MKVYNTIIELLKFKGFCSYPEIAQVSGLKKMDVLQVLNINKDFLKFHPNKKDRIIGLTNGSIMGKFLKEGKIFWVEKENYGAIEVIKFHGNLELKKKLEKQYICGGIGDNYPIMCIENTEENLKEVYGAGLVTYEFLDKQEPVVKYWKENEEKVW